MRTINFVGQNLNLMLATAQNGGTQVIATPRLIWASPWAVRVAGAGLIVLIGTNAWGGFTQ